ncbi:dnaJ homolog l(2)tid, mitochondrial-like [Brevipalpus obovatus]|uniref:dnaJ homolog l(2)tid, mitochondrial-like n=1 Tax=Brevipalpus obovatus TaxID=246614 RepID=UPI003D9E753D
MLLSPGRSLCALGSLSRGKLGEIGCLLPILGYNCDPSIRYGQQVRDVHNFFKRTKIKKNYYEILNVPRNATRRQVKKSYFKLAKMYHPDSHFEGRSAEKFQEVQEAYSILGNDDSREKYDREALEEMGTKYESNDEREQFRSAAAKTRDRDIDHDKAFRKVFGKLKIRPDEKIESAKYAESLDGHQITTHFTLPLTLEEAANGCDKELCVRSVDVCIDCSGSCASKGYRVTRCPFCDENGLEIIKDQPVVTKMKCRVCQGSKKYNKFPCISCEGLGYTIQLKTACFTIPPGVRHGEKLRLAIKNQIMYPVIKIIADDYYRIEGKDIHTIAEISLAQAVLGGKTSVRSLYGNEEIIIPKETSSHSQIKLIHKGLPGEEGETYGHHYVHLKITVPTQLEPEMKNIFGNLAELESETYGTIDGLQKTPEGNKYLNYEDIDTRLLSRVKKYLLS